MNTLVSRLREMARGMRDIKAGTVTTRFKQEAVEAQERAARPDPQESLAELMLGRMERQVGVLGRAAAFINAGTYRDEARTDTGTGNSGSGTVPR